MTSPTEHSAPELAAETGTPLPDSPPATAAAEELLAVPDEQPRSRKRVRSLEPSTPQPEDVHRDPLGTIPYVHTHAHKRNRLEPIGDEEDAPKEASPPASPPLPAEVLLASSPRYESNVRRMNRGVSKLNVRERESSSRTRRKRQGSGDRDNRSSGSGSPRAEEDEAMDATDPAIFMDATDAAIAIASGACVPSSAAEHDAASTSRARSSSPPPKKRRSMDVSPTDTDTASAVDAPPPPAPAVSPPEPTAEHDHVDEDIDIDKASPEPEPAQHEAETAAAPASGSDVTDAPAESEVAQPKDAEPITLTVEAPIAFPPIATPPAPPALLAPAPIIVGGESHKRPRSEEPEPIGRPRSPPPPVPSTMSPSLKSPFGGFASFATNPLKAKAADPPLWASPSASPFGKAKLAENKPPSLASWGSPTPKSIFASPSPSFSATTTPRFMSNFSYKSHSGSPSPFGLPASPGPTPKAEMPAMNVRSVPGGGFGAFSATSGFARFGSQRPTSPPGAVVSSSDNNNRKVNKVKENGSATPASSDSATDEDSDKEPAVSFGDRLKTESGATIETDDEDKVAISRQESMETGEEGEMTIHSQRAKLFAMEGTAWKERGTGTLKLNVSTSDKTSARLVMRADGVYRVILNEKLFYGMSFSVTDSTRTMTFGGAPVDGKVPMYTLRFPSAKVANEIRDKVKDLVPLSKSSGAPTDADDLV